VYLAESNQPPFGKLEPLAILKTNPDGAGVVQAIGPLKALEGNDPNSSPSQRFLICYRHQGFVPYCAAATDAAKAKTP